MSRTDLACCVVIVVWVAIVTVGVTWAIQAHMRGEPAVQCVETERGRVGRVARCNDGTRPEASRASPIHAATETVTVAVLRALWPDAAKAACEWEE